jgi:hypothetical protein
LATSVATTLQDLKVDLRHRNLPQSTAYRRKKAGVLLPYNPSETTKST